MCAAAIAPVTVSRFSFSFSATVLSFENDTEIPTRRRESHKKITKKFLLIHVFIPVGNRKPPQAVGANDCTSVCDIVVALCGVPD